MVTWYIDWFGCGGALCSWAPTFDEKANSTRLRIANFRFIVFSTTNLIASQLKPNVLPKATAGVRTIVRASPELLWNPFNHRSGGHDDSIVKTYRSRQAADTHRKLRCFRFCESEPLSASGTRRGGINRAGSLGSNW